MFIRITDSISVAPQIDPDDCAAAKAQGFAAIINNRPDGEAPGQPGGAHIAAAAAAAGLDYVAIPVDASGLTLALVDAMAAALDAAKGPVLAYCRSGTRSTNLWALAEAKRGGDADAIVAAAAGGGYDVSGLLPMLKRLSGQD
jgi:uncharacterized protein (TIGR01244 family)